MMDWAAKTQGFDPKPLKNAGFGPLVIQNRTTTPLESKYTYDI